LAITKIPIAHRLKQARLIAKLSQKKLGILAGIDEFSSSARINQYEKGKHIPDFLTLKNIANILLVPTAYFYTEDDGLAEMLFLYHTLEHSYKKRILSFCKKVYYIHKNTI